MNLSSGQQLGPYEIIGMAGAGGMGEVYKARDTRLDRTVAIKVLPASFSTTSDLRQRFEREAKAISSLNHPNICILYDVGRHDDIDYLVMEYLEGTTLAERIKTEPLTSREVLEIAVQIADALDKAHRQGLVHRDLKPGNIMLTKDGAKLLDFGLAKLAMEGGVIEGVSGVTRTTPLTGAGTILGTVPYMSPEQLEGKEADARSDIFSFGAVLYEMTTGKRAFEGESQASLIASIMKVHPEKVSRIQPMAPPMLERVISQCLEKDPEHRWQTAGDLKRALQWIVEGGSQAGVPAPVAKRRRLREKLGITFTAILVLTCIALAWLYYGKISEPSRVIKSELLSPPGTTLAGVGGGSIEISPDGTKIVFSAKDSTEANFKLWVRSLDGLTAIPLMGTEGAQFPFWSYDGRYIAFFADGKLKKILATGGPVYTLADATSGRSGSWNQNDEIIFTPTSADIIYKIPAAGGKATPVTQLDTANGEVTHRYAYFLPDGENFLFFDRMEGSDTGAISLGSLNTGEYRQLIAANSGAVYSNGHILYIYDGTLMALPFDAGALAIKGEAFPIAEGLSYLAGWSRGIFSASRNGSLVYRTGLLNLNSYIVEADRTGNIIDTIDASGLHYNLNLFPDESRIAIDLEEQPSQTEADVWVVDIAREIKTRISFDEKTDSNPLISPDGKRILFRSKRAAKNGFYFKNADGTGEIELLRIFDNTVWPYDWASDGSGILTIWETNGEGEVWMVPADSSKEPYPLLQLPEDQYDPVLSPDMRWLAYGSNETGKEQIYVSDFPSLKGRWQVSINEGDRPHWSRDGKKLYFLSNRDEIMETNVDGSGVSFKVGDIRQLFHVENAARPGGIYDVSGDGQTFYLNVRRESVTVNNMILVQNWPAEFEK